MYLPNLEELSFLVVFALPNASIMGLVARKHSILGDEIMVKGGEGKGI
jgi:hypothetical protein